MYVGVSCRVLEISYCCRMEAQREYLTMATKTAEEATSRIIQLEVDQSITKTELLDALRELEQQKRNIGDNIEMAFASVQNRLDAFINDTSRELNNQLGNTPLPSMENKVAMKNSNRNVCNL